MDFEKLNRRPWGKGREKNGYKQRGKEANHKRLVNTENSAHFGSTYTNIKYREQTEG